MICTIILKSFLLISNMAFSSWLPIPTNSPFSLANIPFGIIQRSASDPAHPAIAIGDHVLDLAIFSAHGGFSAIPLPSTLDVSVFAKPTLNAFAALGQPTHRAVRHYLQDVFRRETPYGPILRDNPDLQRQALFPRGSVQNLRPMHVGTFTDFFAGIHHARNCGVIFRGAANALQPNYTHLPVGYHSRASSVVVSGTPVYRPRGQILASSSSSSGDAPPTAAASTTTATTTTGPKAVPILAPCRRLDMELELGAFLCKGNRLGEPIPIDQAHEYIFGYVLVNDWSARDIQAWEAVPLGPFNAKSFCTTISPWVVLPDALEPFRVPALQNPDRDHPGQVPGLLPYLREKVECNVFDINLEVSLSSKF
jgi:fumarylacetoacetase